MTWNSTCYSSTQHLPHSCYFGFSRAACKSYIRSRVYFITYEQCNAMQYSKYLSDISVILTNPISEQNNGHLNNWSILLFKLFTQTK